VRADCTTIREKKSGIKMKIMIKKMMKSKIKIKSKIS